VISSSWTTPFTEPAEPTYRDAKGRLRWHVNDWLGGRLETLAHFLVIGGYEESHATRYPKLAYLISRYPESIMTIHREGRLGELPGVGGTVGSIIGEFLDTGTCEKWREWSRSTPESVLEMTTVPGLGAKLIRAFYQEHGITTLAGLKSALAAGVLDGMPGLGPKTRAAIAASVPPE